MEIHQEQSASAAPTGAQTNVLTMPTIVTLFESDPVRVYGSWSARKICSKEESMRFGRKEWCTAREENNFYHLYTNGILIIFNKETKPRPQFQLYVSKAGAIEFRNGGNAYADFDGFCKENCLTEIAEALTEYKKLAARKETIIGNTRASVGAARAFGVTAFSPGTRSYDDYSGFPRASQVREEQQALFEVLRANAPDIRSASFETDGSVTILCRIPQLFDSVIDELPNPTAVRNFTVVRVLNVMFMALNGFYYFVTHLDNIAVMCSGEQEASEVALLAKPYTLDGAVSLFYNMTLTLR